MTLPTHKLLAPKQLLSTIPEVPSEPETPSTGIPEKDSLILHSWDYLLYIGLFGIAVASTAIIGLLSSKVEYALYFAIGLSVVIIAFLLTS